MTTKYVQVPPDSTGKKVSCHGISDITYENGLVDFYVKAHLYGSTSGASGTVSDLGANNTTSDGILYVLLDHESPSFVAGEELRLGAVGGTLMADIASAPGEGFVQHVMLSGHNNHTYGQHVDIYGAASMRFAEGSPQFDAFGSTRVSSAQPLADYVFGYGLLEGVMPAQVQYEVNGAGTYTHMDGLASVRLQTGVSASDDAQATSNRYHQYRPGNSQLIEMSVRIGDTGKTNVTREWGYFDDDDGVFFRLEGTTLQVVQRSNASGTPVDTVVDQSDFNVDQIDGGLNFVNASKFNIDVSKGNLYWIDLQWLGAGRVRMGVFSETGVRITAHEFRNANAVGAPYMSRGTLPVRFRQENTGTAGSTSEMFVTCMTVKSEGVLAPETEGSFVAVTKEINTLTLSTTEVPICSLRAAATFESLDNRVPIVPSRIFISTDQPIQLSWKVMGTLGGGTSWAAVSGYASEYDDSSTTVSGGTLLVKKYVGAGVTEINISELFEPNHKYVALTADGTQIHHTITGSRLGASDAAADIIFIWAEHGAK